METFVRTDFPFIACKLTLPKDIVLSTNFTPSSSHFAPSSPSFVPSCALSINGDQIACQVIAAHLSDPTAVSQDCQHRPTGFVQLHLGQADDILIDYETATYRKKNKNKLSYYLLKALEYIGQRFNR